MSFELPLECDHGLKSETSNSIKVLRNQKSLMDLVQYLNPFWFYHTPNWTCWILLDLYQRWKMKNLRIWSSIFTTIMKLTQLVLWYPFLDLLRECWLKGHCWKRNWWTLGDYGGRKVSSLWFEVQNRLEIEDTHQWKALIKDNSDQMKQLLFLFSLLHFCLK